MLSKILMGFVGWVDFSFDKCNEKLSREFLKILKFNPSI